MSSCIHAGRLHMSVYVIAIDKLSRPAARRQTGFTRGHSKPAGHSITHTPGLSADGRAERPAAGGADHAAAQRRHGDPGQHRALFFCSRSRPHALFFTALWESWFKERGSPLTPPATIIGDPGLRRAVQRAAG